MTDDNCKKLDELLDMACDAYSIQEIDGQRNMAYDTTYFDTRSFDMYNVHQHGHTNRQKIRFRTYVSSNLQFMEVKTKNNHGRTKKQRIAVTDMNLEDPTKLEFLHSHLHYDTSQLIPALNNHFDRITLVNHDKTERLTIDFDVHFHNMEIIELKRDGLCPSPVLAMLRQLRIHPHGFSKYCMGSALSNDQLPVNRFKRKLIEVDKILKTNI